MEKYTWYVAQRTIKGKWEALAFRQRNNLNLVELIKGLHLTTLNACDSMKEAQEIQYDWNEQFKKNGTYMYD